MEELKEIETTAEAVTENTEIAEPVEENEGLVENEVEFGGGDLAIIGLAIAGAIWGAKSLWKYALKPGYNWAKTRVDELKAKKDEKKAEAESEKDSKDPEDK